jgi:hypothetical protein
MGQSLFTLGFPLKRDTDTKALSDQLASVLPALFKAADEIGTIHYSRFTVLSARTLLFLGEFDGEFGQLMHALARSAGSVFDAIFPHVDSAPPLPVAENVEAFVEWTAAHLLHAAVTFSANPDVTAKEIKTLASAAALAGSGEQHPFLVILPIKSHLAYIETKLLLRAESHRIHKRLASVGVLHYAQFVPLRNLEIGFFAVYGGSFDTYIEALTEHVGPIFDLIFRFVKDPPPSPCRDHLKEFIDFTADANRSPIGFYQAYPGSSVQDIHALIVDSKSA